MTVFKSMGIPFENVWNRRGDCDGNNDGDDDGDFNDEDSINDD